MHFVSRNLEPDEWQIDHCPLEVSVAQTGTLSRAVRIAFCGFTHDEFPLAGDGELCCRTFVPLQVQEVVCFGPRTSSSPVPGDLLITDF
jgi:hypothetical protein